MTIIYKARHSDSQYSLTDDCELILSTTYNPRHVPCLLTDPCETGPCDVEPHCVVIWETMPSQNELAFMYRYKYLAINPDYEVAYQGYQLNVWY